jgi:NifU-like protein involved in Fe-S cluster formation
LGFFDDFRELSESSKFASPHLDEGFVELTNPVCGDMVRVLVRSTDQRVSYYSYQQKGCWPVAGCLELLGRLVDQAPLDDVLAFSLGEFLALVKDVPASKRHAFSLTHRALLMAVGLARAQ